MKLNPFFTCVLTCVLITIAASAMNGEEPKHRTEIKCRIISPLPALRERSTPMQRERAQTPKISPLPGLGARPLPQERSVLTDTYFPHDAKESALKQQLHKRRVEYRDVLLKNFALLQQRNSKLSGDVDHVSKAHIALLEAELAIESEAEQRLKMIRECIEQLKIIEHGQESRFKSGFGREDELYMSMADRIRGEIMLLEEEERQQLP